VRPLVALLSQNSGPTAVSWLVIPVVIYAIDGVLRRRPRAHVGKKCFEAIPPPVTDANAAPTVVFVACYSGVLAPGLHRGPSIVFRSSLPVNPAGAMPLSAGWSFLCYVVRVSVLSHALVVHGAHALGGDLFRAPVDCACLCCAGHQISPAVSAKLAPLDNSSSSIRASSRSIFLIPTSSRSCRCRSLSISLGLARSVRVCSRTVQVRVRADADGEPFPASLEASRRDCFLLADASALSRVDLLMRPSQAGRARRPEGPQQRPKPSSCSLEKPSRP